MWIVESTFEPTAIRALAQVAAAEVANVNPLAGKLQVIAEPRLADPDVSYLIAPPTTMDGAVRVSLAGSPGPQVESPLGLRAGRMAGQDQARHGPRLARVAFLDAARSCRGSRMTATHSPFTLYAGDTWQLDAALHDNDGTALDLTGAVILWRLRNAAQVLVALLSVGDGIAITDALAGLCRITLSPAQTAKFTAGNYSDEIAVTTSTGFVTTQAVGPIVVRRADTAVATSDLAAELAALKKARRSGVRSVTIEGFTTQYATDAELAAAIAATEREIAGNSKPRNLIVRAQKGW